MAAVTPKRAMARRSHTTWHSSAQKPETTKKAKNQRSRRDPPGAADARAARRLYERARAL